MFLLFCDSKLNCQIKIFARHLEVSRYRLPPNPTEKAVRRNAYFHWLCTQWFPSLSIQAAKLNVADICSPIHHCHSIWNLWHCWPFYRPVANQLSSSRYHWKCELLHICRNSFPLHPWASWSSIMHWVHAFSVVIAKLIFAKLYTMLFLAISANLMAASISWYVVVYM